VLARPRCRAARAGREIRVIAFGAHPDETEIKAGGIGVKFTAKGHLVKFVSVTNGDAGHCDRLRRHTTLDGVPTRILTALGVAAAASTARLDPTIHTEGAAAGDDRHGVGHPDGAGHRDERGPHDSERRRAANPLRPGNGLHRRTDRRDRILGQETSPQTPRNAACPCGTGLKFKRCCGDGVPAVLNAA
jgi:SEC-C motif